MSNDDAMFLERPLPRSKHRESFGLPAKLAVRYSSATVRCFGPRGPQPRTELRRGVPGEHPHTTSDRHPEDSQELVVPLLGSVGIRHADIIAKVVRHHQSRGRCNTSGAEAVTLPLKVEPKRFSVVAGQAVWPWPTIPSLCGDGPIRRSESLRQGSSHAESVYGAMPGFSVFPLAGLL